MAHAEHSHISPLHTTLAGMTWNSPIVLAAGTAGYVDELDAVVDTSAIGAIVTKSITAESRVGNVPWRIAGTDLGMLNAIGLANVGLDAFLTDKLPRAGNISPSTTLIGSIAGHSIADYVKVAEAFEAEDVLPAVELNVSCPNTSDGLVFGDNPDALRSLLREIRPIFSGTKMIVKLSPNAPSIVDMAQAAVMGGADVISMINTFTALAIDVETREPIISRGVAGLSGPGIHPIAVRMVHEVYQNVARDADIPILAYGGVLNWQDAAEFILAGATAVGMGTALFIDPTIPARIYDGLMAWVKRQHVQHLSDLIGTYQSPPGN